MRARSVDDVIRDLDEILDYSRRESWRIGYFAALYHHVAIGIKKSSGDFEDPKRVDALDVVFFDRFLAAVDSHRHGGVPSGPWRVAFDAAEAWPPTVMTHLLLGMNAHINFDLGIAVADTVPAAELDGFRSDFDKVNDLLGSLLGVVETDLSRIWPWLGWLHRVAGTVEDGIINFSMRVARQLAWDAAKSLSVLDPAGRKAEIARMDDAVTRLGADIWHPGLLVGAVFAVMRIEQQGSVADLIDILLSDRACGRMNCAVEALHLKWKAEPRG